MNDCDACAGKGENPNCMCGGSGHAKDAVVYLRTRLLQYEEALEFYADPETYLAIGFFPDLPCGPFWDDFSDIEGMARPGKRARDVLMGQPAVTD
jgi:hypothetical protein